jgi:hypothetical protein
MTIAASDYNTKIIEEFRANGGHVGGSLAGTPMILIHCLSHRADNAHYVKLIMANRIPDANSPSP